MNRPPPYNPYMYNNNNQNIYVPTAPPIEGIDQNNTSYSQQYAYNIQNGTNRIPNQYTNTVYPTYPQPIYIPPNSNNTTNEQYRREEIEKRKREEDDICCFGLFGILCCCCLNELEQ